MSVSFSGEERILITGASGLLGRQIIYEALRRNIRPICLVRPESDTIYIDSNQLEKRFADLRNTEQLNSAFRDMDYVIHTAAVVNFRGDKLTMFTGINSFGSRDCYRAAKLCGIKKFVHVSSVVAVGASKRESFAQQGIPLTEDSAFNLTDLKIPYILTKRSAEELLKEESSTGSPTESSSCPDLVTVNPSVIVAPSRHGSDKARIDKALKRLFIPTLPIVFNIVDIRDVASAIVTALLSGKSGANYLLTGANLSVDELLDILETLSGLSPRRITVPRWILNLAAKQALRRNRRRGGKLRIYPELLKMLDYDWIYDSSRAQKELGFSPRPAQETLSDLYNQSFSGTFLDTAG